jgi:hypothetical protein
MSLKLYDIYSSGEDTYCRRIIGTEPKILREPDEDIFDPFPKTFKGLDRAIFVIERIKELERDIERYNKLGRVKDKVNRETGEITYFDYRTLINGTQLQIKRLYEFL